MSGYDLDLVKEFMEWLYTLYEFAPLCHSTAAHHDIFTLPNQAAKSILASDVGLLLRRGAEVCEMSEKSAVSNTASPDVI